MTNENELINILMHMFSRLSLKDNNNSLLFSLCFRNSRSFFYFTAFFQELFVCRGIRIRQSRSFCFWNPKSCATESRLQLKESGIPKLNLLTKNPESRAYNPQSKTVLNLLTKAKNDLFNMCHVPSLPFFFFLNEGFFSPNLRIAKW